MSEKAQDILHQIYMNAILGIVPCDPEEGETREEIFTSYLAETVTSMVTNGDISAVDALYAVGEICPLIWGREKEKGEEKKDA